MAQYTHHFMLAGLTILVFGCSPPKGYKGRTQTPVLKQAEQVVVFDTMPAGATELGHISDFCKSAPMGMALPGTSENCSEGEVLLMLKKQVVSLGGTGLIAPLCERDDGMSASVACSATVIRSNIGLLQLIVYPLNGFAEVRIDGEFIGNTPLHAVPVQEGEHVLELKIGDRVVTRSFAIKMSETARLEVDFDKEPIAAEAGTASPAPPVEAQDEGKTTESSPEEEPAVSPEGQTHRIAP